MCYIQQAFGGHDLMQGTSGGFPSSLAISGMDVQGPAQINGELHLSIALEAKRRKKKRKSWTWTLGHGKGPACFPPAAHGLAKGGRGDGGWGPWI